MKDNSRFWFLAENDQEDSLKITTVFKSYIKNTLCLFKQNKNAFFIKYFNADPVSIENSISFYGLLPPETEHITMFFSEFGASSLFLPTPRFTAALNNTPGTFQILPSCDGTALMEHPFFYMDDRRSFFVVPNELDPPGNFSKDNRKADVRKVIPRLSIFIPKYSFTFFNFYHPYVNRFICELNSAGMNSLLKRESQLKPHLLMYTNREQSEKQFDFGDTYNPQTIVDDLYPKEDVDFEFEGSYSVYNWELFFHIPLLVADRLSKNQRFAEAQAWFHHIFNPYDTTTKEPSVKRYWKTKPFYNDEDSNRWQMPDIFRLLAMSTNPDMSSDLSAEDWKEITKLKNCISAWMENPFKPHVIARLRTIAYQKAVVMKYLDNLIAWGDQLFRRDTIESLNEATQLYVLAAEILGKRPIKQFRGTEPLPKTFNDLENVIDDLSNATVLMEEFLAIDQHKEEFADSRYPPISLYFCVPNNDKLLGYWDKVADRLFKIRHCMNIEGVVRQLPLFEPPIDPDVLVKATAAGVDINSALYDIDPSYNYYRFNVLIQKALELCSDLKSVGSNLLSAIEKRDAEELSNTKARHERELLSLVERLKKQQVDEAKKNEESLEESRNLSITRYKHYQHLLFVSNPTIPEDTESTEIQELPPSLNIRTGEEGIKMIAFEQQELDFLEDASEKQFKGSNYDALASLFHAIPSFNLSPIGVGTSFGGPNLGSATSGFANQERSFSILSNFSGTRAARLAQHVLRENEWTLQSNVSGKEIMQIDKQIAAAKLRKAIAEKELVNHQKQIKHVEEIEEFLRSKYTNEELYSWSVGQITSIYFQAYQLAYEMAKRAEKVYRYELGIKDSNFIRFGYWDNLKKGLLAGEKLHQDLKRLEIAYLEQNKREFEITKHISLAQLDHLALIRLKETNKCNIKLPEVLFDLDFPGHYMRRIKSVGITIPCVVGPYASINCTLKLTKNSVRVENALLNDSQYRRDINNDDRFKEQFVAFQSIVTSSGQNDNGLFESNLRDERYLPFEGAGVISEWDIELPNDFRSFDYESISDVIMHIRYNARDGGDKLKNQVISELKGALNDIRNLSEESGQGLTRLFSLRHEFTGKWQRFIKPPEGQEMKHALTIKLGKEQFPFFVAARAKEISIKSFDVFVNIEPDYSQTHNENTINMTFKKSESTSADKVLLEKWNDLDFFFKGSVPTLGKVEDSWTLEAYMTNGERLIDSAAIKDIILVCWYKLESQS